MSHGIEVKSTSFGLSVRGGEDGATYIGTWVTFRDADNKRHGPFLLPKHLVAAWTAQMADTHNAGLKREGHQ